MTAWRAAPPSRRQVGWFSILPRRSQSAMSRAPIAQMPSPRRPVMTEPSYIFSHSPSTSRGSAPSSISLRPRPIQWVPGASIMARATQGLVSVSPTPNSPSSVWIFTTRSSCAELQASVR